MGNTISEDLEPNDAWWQTQTSEPSNPNTTPMPSSSIQNNTESETSEEECNRIVERLSLETRRKAHEEKMEEFRAELAQKHLARRQAIAERSKEIMFLREELAKYRKENEDLKEALSNATTLDVAHMVPQVEDTSWKDDMDELRRQNQELNERVGSLEEELGGCRGFQKQNHELRLNIAEVQEELQSANSQVVAFEKERQDYQNHVSAMKEVVAVSKQLLEIRERQLEEVRAKVSEIEANISEKETSMLSTNLRNEYEKQLRNMRALRMLYDQRQAALKADRDAIAKELDETTKKLETEQSKSKELEERIAELEEDVSNKYDKIHNLESQLGFSKAEGRELQAEMSVINQLFSQILIGFNNGQVDLDKLIKLLEENHDLLKDIVVNEESALHSSALSKTLLDLVNRVQEKEESSLKTEAGGSEGVAADVTTSSEESQPEQSTSSQISSAAEIVHNLPKVWRVLAELLSQHSGQQPVVINEGGMDPCYKSIETPKGPKLVLSVSQTFIRLKDLILEKKSLEKEMTRLKHLNTHLESRLQDQEKRLETVSTELSKTWHVVGRMQRQHQQLHTHEQILRYELAQKRKMLTELKQELEYCKEKWEQAREKNSTTEEQWKKLRKEFASRKNTTVEDSNNSAESGYSDERECSSDEDVSFSSSKKKRQEDVPSPKGGSDTEDNDEVSHESDGEDLLESAFSKACSKQTLEQPQMAISEVMVLTPESPVTESVPTYEASSTESRNCDIPESESGRIEAKTDKEVQINDNVSQVEKDTDNDKNNNCYVYVNLQKSICDIDVTQIDFSTIKIPECLMENLESTKKDFQETPSIPPPPPLPPAPLYTANETKPVRKKDETCRNESPTASSSRTDPKQLTNEERLSRREERLRRLEEQCKQLVKKVTNTTNKGVEICSRLEILHEQYGSTSEQELTESIEVTDPTETTDRTETIETTERTETIERTETTETPLPNRTTEAREIEEDTQNENNT